MRTSQMSTHPVIFRSIDVGARLNHDAHRLCVALLGCDEQGRGPGPFGAVAVRTGRAQEPDDLGMSLYNRGESIEEYLPSEGGAKEKERRETGGVQ